MEDSSSRPETRAQLPNLPRSRTMQRYLSRSSLSQVPSPATGEMQQLIRRPANASNTSNNCRSIHQQIWQAEGVSRGDLVVALSLAQTQLKHVVKEHIPVLQKQIEKLTAHIEHGIHLSVTEAEDDEETKNGDIRGAIVQAVLARWSHEDAVQAITGRRPGDAGGMAETDDAAAMMEWRSVRG